MKRVVRCPWPLDDPLMIAYHDKEWGWAVHDDQKHYEFLLLDAMQAGLSWKTILHKRENFRRAFADFDPEKVARFTVKRIEKLLCDPGIIRNRLKVEAAVTNARCFLRVQEEFGTFDSYIWRFTAGKTIDSRLKSLTRIQATSRESDAMSKDLKARGFKFVGSTICYAYMQAAGMVNDHLMSCFRYKQIMAAQQG